MHRIVALLVALTVTAAPMSSFAHGGGLDSDGCHVDNQRGGRHCHRAQDDSFTADANALQGWQIGVLIGLGVVAVGSTAFVIWLAMEEEKSKRSSLELAPVLTPDRAGVQVLWRF